MQSNTATLLQEIGDQLDIDIFPEVTNGGILLPSKSLPLHKTLGEEKDNDRKRRSKTKSGERTTGRQGTTSRGGSASQTTQIISTNLRKLYEEQLGDVLVAYPNTQIVKRDDGLWLISESNLLPDFKGKAIFLTSIPYYLGILPRSWACWDSFQWIGPRHTNYPDGSVCAFEQSDGSWLPGGSVVELLDMYTLWALRHLHFSMFGRWPGYQRVHTSYERISELTENEFCGCDKPIGLYKDCCQKSDKSINNIAMATIFNIRSGGLRKPPLCFEEYINSHSMLPNISEVCF